MITQKYTPRARRNFGLDRFYETQTNRNNNQIIMIPGIYYLS